MKFRFIYIYIVKLKFQLCCFVDTVGIACAEVRYLTQLLIDPSLDFDDTNEEDASQEIALIRSRFENVFALLFILRSVREE